MRLNEPVAEIRRTRAVAAEPQAIWNVLADFGAISGWSDKVDHSCLLSPKAQDLGVSTTRRVQVGRNTLVERITEFDPPSTLAYDVEGFPRWLRVNNRWTLTPSASATAVSLVSTITVAGPLGRIVEGVVTPACVKTLDGLLTGLARKLEGHRV
ncbi:SRPBCC family protein [Mycolicibacterium helvum]|uniref:MxaD family protein n=1 Tax=Mycolicibacterium helvum TaxID=1534349 RepID=A0A7I7T3N1_9MYCO|nr:SRPBCC family protein [Mycolicibacterium helvum]BBY63570.1 MxaD family protein [Mycolicibacterium helvum]